ncbi:hypothetical protein FRB94_000188 [Tulasnella sp. JGI-2019a]|nr:hypothetical protein FRB94_000188 [Tulasnella sp. JGI-2019a]
MQIFAGEEIDMDLFDRTAGPDKDARSRNVAANPFAAAKFFRFVITAVLETLFNIDASGQQVQSDMGVLGEVEAYFGVVEAQGRGTLHLHMLVWLRHAPTSEEMHDLLQDEKFRLKVTEYIRANIRAHLEGFTKEGIKSMPQEKELAYSRPPDPTSEDYEHQSIVRERETVRAQQVHTCTKRTCLIFDTQKAKWVCKWRAPFPLLEEDTVRCDGTCGPKRTYGYLNNSNPAVTECLCCNNDAKLLTNGRETKDSAWYMTGYQTKKTAENSQCLGTACNRRRIPSQSDYRNRRYPRTEPASSLLLLPVTES